MKTKMKLGYCAVTAIVITLSVIAIFCKDYTNAAWLLCAALWVCGIYLCHKKILSLSASLAEVVKISNKNAESVHKAKKVNDELVARIKKLEALTPSRAKNGKFVKRNKK